MQALSNLILFSDDFLHLLLFAAGFVGGWAFKAVKVKNQELKFSIEKD